jgi:hypothetical protein
MVAATVAEKPTTVLAQDVPNITAIVRHAWTSLSVSSNANARTHMRNQFDRHVTFFGIAIPISVLQQIQDRAGELGVQFVNRRRLNPEAR